MCVKTFGCKVNQVESSDVAARLSAAGFVHASEEAADAVIINTCTVTLEADRKVRKAIRHVAALPGAPAVVVTGCSATLHAAELQELAERVVVETDKSAVPDLVARLLAGREGVARTPDTRPLEPPSQLATGASTRTRAMLKVQDGCDAYCAYCIVPYVRGTPSPVPFDEIVCRARDLVAAGTREIVVTGINVGKYRDDSGRRLADVLAAIAATGVKRIRLSSVEPGDLDDSLLSALSHTQAFCPHLHVPLQSGSDAVLRAMRRTYTAEEYLDALARARDAIPGLAVTTDVICGFPGESAEDAAATSELCVQAGFSKLHVFRYSKRPGTLAATMAGHVDGFEIARRADALRAVGDELRSEFLDGKVGSTVEVLVEKIDAMAGFAEGTTGDYARVRIGLLPDGPTSVSTRVGELVQVKVVSRDGMLLVAEPDVEFASDSNSA